MSNCSNWLNKSFNIIPYILILLNRKFLLDHGNYFWLDLLLFIIGSYNNFIISTNIYKIVILTLEQGIINYKTKTKQYTSYNQKCIFTDLKLYYKIYLHLVVEQYFNAISEYHIHSPNNLGHQNNLYYYSHSQ